VRFGSGRRRVSAILVIACWFSGCTHRHDGYARLEAKKSEAEAILARDPANYHALHDLAIIYGSFYMRDVMTGGASLAADKERALTLTRDALAKAPLSDKPDLGLNLEKLEHEQEALTVYDNFLRNASPSQMPNSTVFSNSPDVVKREMEAEWQGLIALTRAREDLLKKKLAGQQTPP
jgi:hypothetical protein